MKFIILVNPSLIIIIIYSLLEKRRRFLKKNVNSTLQTQKLPHLGVGGYEIYNFFVFLPDRYYMYIFNLVKIGLVVLEKKTEHYGRRIRHTYSSVPKVKIIFKMSLLFHIKQPFFKKSILKTFLIQF